MHTKKFTLLERDDREEMYSKTEQYDPWREGHVGLDYIGLQCPVNNRGSSQIRGTLGKQKHYKTSCPTPLLPQRSTNIFCHALITIFHSATLLFLKAATKLKWKTSSSQITVPATTVLHRIHYWTLVEEGSLWRGPCTHLIVCACQA